MCSIIQTVSYIRSQPDGIITFWNERVNYEFYTNVNYSNILFVVMSCAVCGKPASPVRKTTSFVTMASLAGMMLKNCNSKNEEDQTMG